MTYQLPKVWSAADSDQGKFSGINQPTAGARFEQKLPVGKEPFQLYSLGTPNGVKVRQTMISIRLVLWMEISLDQTL